ncbi:hypothetical protein EJB05_45164, partial [Eragrostis curvula]
MLPSPDLIWDDEEDMTMKRTMTSAPPAGASCCLRNPRVAHRRARSISLLSGVDTNNRYGGRSLHLRTGTASSPAHLN